MPIDRFINERKNVWQRLEELLQLLDRMTLRKLHREEVRELGRIYRRTASDLVIARSESRDPRLINYLNSLVIRAQGRIYRADAQGGQRIRNFFASEFPCAFRRTWRYTATSFGVFLLFTAIAFFGTRHDPDFSEFAGVDPFFAPSTSKRDALVGTSERSKSGWLDANLYEQHQSDLLCFCVGAIFGWERSIYWPLMAPASERFWPWFTAPVLATIYCSAL
jgi:hypothetical protein